MRQVKGWNLKIPSFSIKKEKLWEKSVGQANQLVIGGELHKIGSYDEETPARPSPYHIHHPAVK